MEIMTRIALPTPPQVVSSLLPPPSHRFIDHFPLSQHTARPFLRWPSYQSGITICGIHSVVHGFGSGRDVSSQALIISKITQALCRLLLGGY